MSFDDFVASDERIHLLRGKRPLYAYRCTSEEAETLSRYLTLLLETFSPERLGDADCALLCIYLSVYLNQNYSGGAWTWNEALSSLNISLGAGFRPHQFYTLLERGLRRWGRQIFMLNRRRRFLATIVREGGLPKALLIQDDSKLQNFFTKLFNHLERHFATRSDAPDVFVDAGRLFLTELPRSLQSEDFLGLLSHLAWQVSQLVNELEPGESQPLEVLNDKLPDWRDELPFYLEDDAAQKLLKSLLSHAKALPQKSIAVAKIETVLRLSPSSQPRLERTLSMPARLPDSGLNQLIRNGKAGAEEGRPLPFRMLVSLVGVEGKPLEQGILSTRGSEKNPYWSYERTRLNSVEEPERQLSLELTTGTRRISSWTPPGGMGLSDLPWVFTKGKQDAKENQNESYWTLVASGSHCSTQTELLVAVPSSLHAEPTPGTQWQRHESSACKRELFYLKGEVCFKVDRQLIRIRSSSVHDYEPDKYELRGKQFLDHVGSETLFLSLPQLVRRSSDGSIYDIPVEEVIYRARGGSWMPSNQAGYGALTIRHVKNGEVMAETRATRLPDDFRIDPILQEPPRPGILRFSSQMLTSVGIVPGKTAPFQPGGSRPGCCELHLTSDQRLKPSASLSLFCPVEVVFSSAKVKLSVSLPHQQVGFFMSDGSACNTKEPISIDELDLIQAVAIDTLRTDYYLEACLITSHVGNAGPLSFSQKLEREANHVQRLPMRRLVGALELLMASTIDPTAKVQLRIFAPGRSKHSECTLRVQRNESCLQVDSQSGKVSLTSSLQNIRGLELMAVNLNSAAFKQERLLESKVPRLDQPSWSFFDPQCRGKRRASGCWLLFARGPHAQRIRPLLWNISSKTQNTSAPAHDPWREALGQRNREKSLRQLKDLLRELPPAPNGQGWPLVAQCWKALKHLPPTVLMVLPALAESPGAVALFALHADSQEELDERWQALEQLPFMWELVPIGVWSKAIDGMRKYERSVKSKEYPTKSVQEQEWMADDALFDRLGRIACRLPTIWLSVINYQSIWQRISLPDEIQLILNSSDQVLAEQLVQEQQRLRQRLADVSWPQFPGLKLPNIPKNVFRMLPKSFLPDEPAGAEFRKPLLHAPLLVAIASQFQDVPLENAEIYFLRELRAYDEAAFNLQYRLGMALLQLHLASAAGPNPKGGHP